MNRHLRRALRAVSLTTTLTATIALAAPGAYADDAPTTNVGETVDDTIATVTDTLDTVSKGCVPTSVYSWEGIWNTPTRYTVPNGSVWYHESGGATPRILCPGTFRVTALIVDETTTSPVVWGTYFNSEQVVTTDTTPSLVAHVNVPYAGPDAATVPVVGDAPLPRPYGQITVQVKVERRVSTGRYSALTNGCAEFYYLIQPEAGFFVSDPTRGDGAKFTPCATDAKILTLDTLDNIETG